MFYPRARIRKVFPPCISRFNKIDGLHSRYLHSYPITQKEFCNRAALVSFVCLAFCVNLENAWRPVTSSMRTVIPVRFFFLLDVHPFDHFVLPGLKVILNIGHFGNIKTKLYGHHGKVGPFVPIVADCWSWKRMRRSELYSTRTVFK